MNDLQAAKAAVVTLESELSKRTVEAENAQRKASQLREMVSRLAGSMALDGTNFTEQINGARTELVSVEAISQLFPDVKAELQRRLESARGELKRHEIDVMSAALHEMIAVEDGLRGEFFETGAAFLAAADRLKLQIARKEAAKFQITEAGGSARDIPQTSMPPFFQNWVRSGSGVQSARQEWGVARAAAIAE